MEFRLNKFESVFVFVLLMLLRYHVVFVLAQQLTFNYTQTDTRIDAHTYLYIGTWPLFLLTIYGIAHKLMNKLFCVVVLQCVLVS